MALSICRSFGRSLARNSMLIDASLKPLLIRFNHSLLQIQKQAPDFKGQAVAVYLFFYPLDFTFVCPTEIIAFNDRASEFKALNTELIACSVDSHFSHLAWANQPRKQGGLGNINIPLLSDLSKKISQDYNVLLDAGISLRGSFLIDPKGVLRQMTVNDLPVGRSVDEAIRLIKAFQFTDKHGEVCPANWEPEKPTINPKNAKEYFSKVN